MQHMLKILITSLLLLVSVALGTLAMDNSKVDHFTIRYPLDSTSRASPDANTPNPKLPNLSAHGKKLEEKFASDLLRNPRIQKHIGTERIFSSWYEHVHAENDRNYHHRYMNDYANDIEALKDRKKSTSGEQSSRSPLPLKKERKLNKKYERSKQSRDKYREKMRDIRKDAYIHKEAGNFSDKDVHYVTQMFHDDSPSLGYLSDGRHVSSPRNPKLSKSRSANFQSEPSSSPKLSRSRSVKAERCRIDFYILVPRSYLAFFSFLSLINLDFYFKLFFSTLTYFRFSFRKITKPLFSMSINSGPRFTSSFNVLKSPMIL